MKSRTFLFVVLSLLAAGVLATVFHLIYAYQAYQNCSIIQFIAGEMW